MVRPRASIGFWLSGASAARGFAWTTFLWVAAVPRSPRSASECGRPEGKLGAATSAMRIASGRWSAPWNSGSTSSTPRKRTGTAILRKRCRRRSRTSGAITSSSLQHAPASDRGGGSPLLQAGGDRDLGVESDRERHPLRQVPRREEAQRPDPRGRGSLQTREPARDGPPNPRAPEDRTGPSEDARPGRPRLASPPSARHPDSRGEASVSIRGERGRRRVVPEWPGNPNGGRDLEAPAARYVLSVTASSGATSPRARPP